MNTEEIYKTITDYRDFKLSTEERDHLDKWLEEKESYIQLFEILIDEEAEAFLVSVEYDGEEIGAIVHNPDPMKYEVWMNDELKFTLRCEAGGVEMRSWSLIDKPEFQY